MDKEKDKKKTLTISSNFKKKIDTSSLLKNEKKINYQGFVEANEITDTSNHVIVTDGFSGNIALKTAEGVSKFITDSLKKASPHLFMQKFYLFF